MTARTIKAMVAEAQAKGERTFDPGKPCPKGHASHRYAYNNAPCVQCLKEYQTKTRTSKPGYKPRPAICIQQENGLWLGDPCPKCGDKWRTNPDRKCVTCRKAKNSIRNDHKRRIARESYHRDLERSRACKRRAKQKNIAANYELAAWRRAELAARKKLPLSKEQRAWIREFYRNRPDGYEVDHIVGLKSRLCCGLHVPANLQYLPMSDNRKKSRKWPTCQKSMQPAWFDDKN